MSHDSETSNTADMAEHITLGATAVPDVKKMAQLQTVTHLLQPAICVLILLAFTLRVYRLDFVSLRGDESLTALFSSWPLSQLWEGIRTIEPNPPLYYFVLRSAILAFGQTDFTTRYVSVLFGVLAVPLVYQLGHTLIPNTRLGCVVGLLAAFLLAINPYQIWHSQDVRNYTLWPTLSLVSLIFWWRTLRENRRSGWAVYIITALVSLYTHYYDTFIILFENVFVFLVHRRNRSLLKRWIVAQVILAVLYLPWPLFFSSRPLTYIAVTPDLPGPLGIVRQSLTAFALGETIPRQLAIVLLPLLVLLLVLGLVFAFRQDRRVFTFLLLYLAVPSLCIYLFTLWRPLFRQRYLNMIAPGYYLAFALGLARLARLRRGSVLATGAGLAILIVPTMLSLSHYYFDPRYAKSPDWRGLAAYLETQAQANDVIVQNHIDPTLVYYYSGDSFRIVLPDRSAVDPVGDLPVDRVATGDKLRQLLAQHRRLWLLPVQSGWDPQGFVEGWLNRRARKVYEGQAAGFRVIAYERAEVPTPTIRYPLISSLNQGVQLAGYDVRANAECRAREAGAAGPRLLIANPGACVVHLTLYWRAISAMDAAYTVFTHLLDADNQIWAQLDSQPQKGQFPTTEWLPGDLIQDVYDLTLSPDVPPGQYTLKVGMYRLETGERLPAFDSEGRRWEHDAIQLDLSIEMAP
jgi:4-amino-4-deoxy-L-arabinose transferase-like glycosyltransferase